MNISSRLKLAMKEKGITQSELARRADISKSTISEWVSGKYEPKQDNVFILAQALRISPSWLMGLTESMEVYKDIERIYSQLKPHRQESVYNYAENQLNEQNNVEETQDIYLVGQTAAGSGIAYNQLNAEQINTNVPAGADYALTVRGNSMEPLIHDGQIIFYKQQPVVENGEIAIVELNGSEVTCKKFYAEDGKVVLKSINEEYEDMVITDSIRVIGKVIL